MQGEPIKVKQIRQDDDKSAKTLKYLRAFNIATAIVVIVLSVLSLVIIIIDCLASLKFFLVFSPVFMVGFGLALLGAQFKIRFVLKKLPFLKTCLGRGLTYIYMSSIIYYYFYVIQGSQYLGWIGAIALFVSGMVYMGIHFGCAKNLKREDLQQEYQETYKQRLV